jgi:hypothetical protein
VLFVPWVAVLHRLMRASGAAASALRAVSPAHGTLEAGARLFGNARARRRLSLGRMRRFRGLVEFFVRFSVKFGVFPSVFSPVLFSAPFFVFC